MYCFADLVAPTIWICVECIDVVTTIGKEYDSPKESLTNPLVETHAWLTRSVPSS